MSGFSAVNPEAGPGDGLDCHQQGCNFLSGWDTSLFRQRDFVTTAKPSGPPDSKNIGQETGNPIGRVPNKRCLLAKKSLE